MDLREITKIVKAAAETINASEEFIVHSLAARALRAAEENPYDTSLLTCSQVLNKMAETKMFISRAELNKLYDSVYTNGTKLGEVFEVELDRKALQGPKLFSRTADEQKEFNYEASADPLLANALSNIFEGGEHKLYTAKAQRNAERICNASLLELGLAPKKVSVFAGRDNIILCQATYETPKGQSNVIVPVEMKDDVALFPTMFLGKEAFVDLTQEFLKDHIISTAGFSFRVDGEGILNVLSQAKNGVKKIASEVEMAAIRLRASKADTAYDINGIVGMKLVEAHVERDLQPEVEKSQEHFDFSKRVTSSDGAARFLFGDRVVSAGRDTIVRKMAEFGYKNIQVKVKDCTDKQVHYAVAVGLGTGILVPVDCTKERASFPRIAVASGKVKEFTKAGIDELVKDTKADTRMLAHASTSSGLKPSELIQQIKEAVEEGNLIKAEDAINVLGEIDKSAQKVGVGILLRGLSTAKESINFDKVASTPVYDTPIFNTYNVFFPEETVKFKSASENFNQIINSVKQYLLSKGINYSWNYSSQDSNKLNLNIKILDSNINAKLIENELNDLLKSEFNTPVYLNVYKDNEYMDGPQ